MVPDDEDAPTKAGRAMQRVMREFGWSQAELARRAGIDPRTLRRWVKGEKNPPEDRVADKLVGLGLDPAAYGIMDRPRVVPITSTPAEAALREDVRILAAQVHDLSAQITEMARELNKVFRALKSPDESE